MITRRRTSRRRRRNWCPNLEDLLRGRFVSLGYCLNHHLNNGLVPNNAISYGSILLSFFSDTHTTNSKSYSTKWLFNREHHSIHGTRLSGPGGEGKGWLGGWGALLKQQNIRELFRYSAAEMFFPEYQNICIFVFQTWAQVVNQDFPGTRVWPTDYCHKPVLDEQMCNAIDGSTFVPSGNQIWPAGIPMACAFKFI